MILVDIASHEPYFLTHSLDEKKKNLLLCGTGFKAKHRVLYTHKQKPFCQANWNGRNNIWSEMNNIF